MKFNFYPRKYICLDYRRGTILLNAYKDEHEEEKFLMDIHYHPDNYGLIHHIVGFYIDDDKDETMQREAKRLILSGYIDNAINGIENEMDEYEEFCCEMIEKNINSKNN